MNNDKVNFVGTEESAGPNQQQGTSLRAQTLGRYSTPWSNLLVYIFLL